MKFLNATVKNLLLVLSIVPMSAYCLDPKLGVIREQEQRTAIAVERILEAARETTLMRIERAAYQITRQHRQDLYPNEPLSDGAIYNTIARLSPEGSSRLIERASVMALTTLRQEELQEQQQARRNSRLPDRTEDTSGKRHRGQ